MPLHTLSKTVKMMPFTATFFFLFLVSIQPIKAEKQASIVLPPMTVFGIKKPDNTFTQKSEVAWHDANDPTIVHEKDGTYTANSTTNSYSLKSLLVSLGSPTVNIDLGYAANSTSMNADGNLLLSKLFEAFEYLGDEVTLQLTPTLEASEQLSRRLMQRRLEVLSKTLARHTQVRFKVMPAKVLSVGTTKHRRSEVWRVQIRRTS